MAGVQRAVEPVQMADDARPVRQPKLERVTVVRQVSPTLAVGSLIRGALGERRLTLTIAEWASDELQSGQSDDLIAGRCDVVTQQLRRPHRLSERTARRLPSLV